MLWSGAIVDIPNGWALCDGTNGTPDLRNRFIVGAGATYAVGATGGSLTHNHSYTTSVEVDTAQGYVTPHQCTLEDGSDIDYAYYDPYYSQYSEEHDHQYDITTNGHDHGGYTDLGDGAPPYYALAFIMKL